MADRKIKANDRLGQIKDQVNKSHPTTTTTTTMSKKSPTELPWDPDHTDFPTRKNLPKLEGCPEGAAWVWGKDDYVGRINLLTPARVAAASKEIKSGEIVPVNMPLNEPDPPVLGRVAFKHEIKPLVPGVAYDDFYTLNTQSGTQWDGLRHFGHAASKTFYNHIKEEDVVGPNANTKGGIHYWAEHGIAGRGVLLDVWGYCQAHGIVYDPYTDYSITLDLLTAVGKKQGVDIRPQAQGGDIRPGDMLFIRSGWTYTYRSKTPEQRRALAERKATMGPDNETKFAGVEQTEAMLDWLHDTYFAAVAGDVPAFEVWPAKGDYHLHESIITRWGMPIGEMLDLERLASTCRAKGRWTFFFASAPANMPGGVASHVNGNAIF